MKTQSKYFRSSLKIKQLNSIYIYKFRTHVIKFNSKALTTKQKCVLSNPNIHMTLYYSEVNALNYGHQSDSL